MATKSPPTPTMTSGHGVVLSHLDGFLLGHHEPGKVAQIDAWVEDILTAILLFGRATIAAPPAITAEIEPLVRRLISEDLIAFDTTDYSALSRAKVSRGLSVGAESHVQLERDSRTSIFVDLHTLMHKGYHSFSSAAYEEQAARATFARSALKEFLVPASNLLGSIFSQYHIHSLFIYANSLADMYSGGFDAQEYTPGVTINEDPDVLFESLIGEFFSPEGNINPDVLFEICKIRPLTPHEVDAIRMRTGFIHDYTGSDLERIWDLEKHMLLPGEFEAYAMTMMELRTRPNPPVFLAAHCFWRTIFDLLNQVQCSRTSGAHIFMPPFFRPQTKAASSVTSQDATHIYRLYLATNVRVPRISSVEALLRLRADQRIIPLRVTIESWIDALHHGDLKLAERIGGDMALAQRSLESIGMLRLVASVSAIVALPLAIVIPAMMFPALLGAASWNYFRGPSNFDWIHFGE